MNDHIREEGLALYITGDLTEADMAGVRQHLQTCSDCRSLAAGLEQTAEALGSLSDEPRPESLAEVRVRVRARLGRRKAHGWQWGVAAAAAAIVVICFAWYRPAPVPPAPKIPEIAATPPAPPANFVDAAKSQRGRRPRDRSPAPRPGIKSVALLAQREGPPIIKITTTDPNVLILLASDERKKTE